MIALPTFCAFVVLWSKNLHSVAFERSFASSIISLALAPGRLVNGVFPAGLRHPGDIRGVDGIGPAHGAKAIG